jgi:hypothetical protein
MSLVEGDFAGHCFDRWRMLWDGVWDGVGVKRRGRGERTLHDAEGDDEVLDGLVHRSNLLFVYIAPNPSQTQE